MSMGPMPYGNFLPEEEEEEQIPETVQLLRAFEDKADDKPGASEALRGLSSLYGGNSVTPTGNDVTTQEGAKTAMKGYAAVNAPEDPMAEDSGKLPFKQALLSALKEAGPTLAMSGIAGLMGGKSDMGQVMGIAAGSMGKQLMERTQMEQKANLERRQKAWMTAYEEAQQIPQDILMAKPELAQAVMAFQKDMKDMTVDNEKTFSEYLKQMALNRDDIAEMAMQREAEMRRNTELEDQKARVASLVERANAGDVQAQAELAQGADLAQDDQGNWYSKAEKQRTEMAEREMANREQSTSQAYQMHKERLEAQAAQHREAMAHSERLAAAGREAEALGVGLKSIEDQIQMWKVLGEQEAREKGLTGDAAAQAINEAEARAVVSTAEDTMRLAEHQGLIKRAPVAPGGPVEPLAPDFAHEPEVIEEQQKRQQASEMIIIEGLGPTYFPDPARLEQMQVEIEETKKRLEIAMAGGDMPWTMPPDRNAPPPPRPGAGMPAGPGMVTPGIMDTTNNNMQPNRGRVIEGLQRRLDNLQNRFDSDMLAIATVTQGLRTALQERYAQYK